MAELYVIEGEWESGYAEGSPQQALDNLVTSEHRDKPLFMAVVEALTSGLVQGQAFLGEASMVHNLDTATGAQLDQIGEWVGLSRYLPVPLVGVYFEWDSTAELGWDGGSWQGPFDPNSGMTRLPDDAYRTYLRAKIAANSWDGTLPSAYDVMSIAFGDNHQIILQDNQDMSMTVAIAGDTLGAVVIGLLVSGALPLKPSGVRIALYALPADTGKLFAWDSDGPWLAGWGPGSWAREIYPASDSFVDIFAWDTVGTPGYAGWGAASWVAGA